MKTANAKSANSNVQNPITEGNILKALLYFFFPILFGTFFQQLYTTVDAIIVGRFVGTQALASVGGGSAVFVNLLVGFFMGISSGAGVSISQFYGARNRREISAAVHTSIALSIAGGIVIMICGIVFSRPMLVLTKTPAEIIDNSVLYLRIYFLGIIPMFLQNMGSGILRAVGNSKTPLIILIVGCVSNILLDLLLVIVFRLGVAGVALATVLCQIETAIIALVILAGTKDDYRFEPKLTRFTPHILAKILKIGLPAGLQGTLYTISNLIIQTNINTFGTVSVAAWAAYGKIDGVFWMTVSALGIAVTTFAGQNFGAQKYGRVKKGMLITLELTAALTVIISLFFWNCSEMLVGLFSDDRAVIEKGIEILEFLVPFYMTYISIEVLSGATRGIGKSLCPLLITVFGVCALRLIWLFTVVKMKPQMETVLTSYPITWIVTSAAFWIYWLICCRKMNKMESLAEKEA